LGLYEFHYLSSLVPRVLMRDWEPPADKGKPFPGLKRWVVKQTAKAVGKRLHQHWKRLLAQVNPIVLEVQRKMFAATMTLGDLASDEELYRHKGVVDDIINYRAAAIAAVNVGYLAHCHVHIRSEGGYGAAQLDAQQEYLLQLVGPHGLDLCSRIRPGERVRRLLHRIHIELMKNWRDLFSDTGRTYASLDRTLMDLPGGIPGTLVSKLNRWHLERPYTERLELMALLLYGECDSKHNAHVFQHARVPDIKRAMRRVADATHHELSPRRTKDVKLVVDYLADYPEEHAGDISGLARRSIEWHGEQHDREIGEELDRSGVDTETALPPKLHDIDDLAFLQTVADVRE
jgi:hypothetical protein